VRDARGALVHVRTAEGECIGCIEVGLYEIVRMVIEEEARAAARGSEGSPGATAATLILASEAQ
jgi:hypothetical protein